MSARQVVDIGLYEAALRDIDLPMGLRVESVHLSGSELQLSNDPLRAVASEPGRARIVVLEAALTDFISKTPPSGIKNVQIRLADGKLHFEALKTVLVDLKLKAVCTMRIEDESAVFIDVNSVEMAGAGVKHFVQSHIDKINPIIKTSMLPFPTRLKGIELANGKLTIWGEVSPPQ